MIAFSFLIGVTVVAGSGGCKSALFGDCARRGRLTEFLRGWTSFGWVGLSKSSTSSLESPGGGVELRTLSYLNAGCFVGVIVTAAFIEALSRDADLVTLRSNSSKAWPSLLSSESASLGTLKV